MAYNKNLKDIMTTKTLAIPAAAATGYTGVLNIGNNVKADVELRIATPALPSLVDTKTVIITVQHSVDEAFTSPIDTFMTHTLTGAGGVGAAATEVRYALGETLLAFIRAKVVVLAAAGDNTASSVTFEIVA